MIEVSPLLYVGSDKDLVGYDGAGRIVAVSNLLEDPNWAIVSAAKDPWHRAALGYTTPGCPKDHPEYLWARRGDHLILNMVDVDDPRYFAPAMVNEALAFMWDRLESGMRVLVHCNQGESRAPSLALLYLRATVYKYNDLQPLYAKLLFKNDYPAYNPKAGIWGYLESHWNDFLQEKTAPDWPDWRLTA